MNPKTVYFRTGDYMTKAKIRRSVAHKTTFRTYIKALTESTIETFLRNPFNLKRKDAERCAKEVMAIIKRNHLNAAANGRIKW